ncbi:uncharacterized protein LOC142817702 isoform X2 [Rhipicephalus microplus]|uniref:uncharacterized protein LOC142793132 isoform X2 n=1 Tax=Rhipicephalus microplus TaxID=6941 RepID=UPI003F6CBD92
MASLVFINAIRSSPAVICRHRHPSLHAGDNHAGYGPPLHAEPYACHACVLGPMAIRRGHLEATGTTPPRAQLETTDCVKVYEVIYGRRLQCSCMCRQVQQSSHRQCFSCCRPWFFAAVRCSSGGWAVVFRHERAFHD